MDQAMLMDMASRYIQQKGLPNNAQNVNDVINAFVQHPAIAQQYVSRADDFAARLGNRRPDLPLQQGQGQDVEAMLDQILASEQVQGQAPMQSFAANLPELEEFTELPMQQNRTATAQVAAQKPSRKSVVKADAAADAAANPAANAAAPTPDVPVSEADGGGSGDLLLPILLAILGGGAAGRYMAKGRNAIPPSTADTDVAANLALPSPQPALPPSQRALPPPQRKLPPPAADGTTPRSPTLSPAPHGGTFDTEIEDAIANATTPYTHTYDLDEADAAIPDMPSPPDTDTFYPGANIATETARTAPPATATKKKAAAKKKATTKAPLSTRQRQLRARAAERALGGMVADAAVTVTPRGTYSITVKGKKLGNQDWATVDDATRYIQGRIRDGKFVDKR